MGHKLQKFSRGLKSIDLFINYAVVWLLVYSLGVEEQQQLLKSIDLFINYAVVWLLIFSLCIEELRCCYMEATLYCLFGCFSLGIEKSIDLFIKYAVVWLLFLAMI